MVIERNIFKIMTLLNNLVLIWNLSHYNRVFCSFYTFREICFLMKHSSCKLQLESWNMNRKPLNQTLVFINKRYSEPSHIFKLELFAKIIWNGWKLLNIFVKSFIFDLRKGSIYILFLERLMTRKFRDVLIFSFLN